ncbi:TIGR01777 family oxidoreductase [Alteromonas sp. C1M14]|uniref:TIGR01777 family oxidoreductase n=1 Tax=Alteromonas sp. C1M14 TaxID=2841567 RepID=UPI001C087DEF|nr:TIGR01777 family oxidoreductase [Alteromonas sp. C1M14]MBU2977470.1 TIGR01777 family oxidoreductase [Alteromonas sp. C1M14]
MNIFITGGTGLIGKHLIAALQPDHQCTVLTRDPEKAASVLPESVTFITTLHEVPDFSVFDGVINLAGEPIADKRWSSLQKQRICQSRWDLTTQLVDRITHCKQPPSVFLSGSAIGFYGRQGDEKVTEDTYTVHPEFSHEVCQRWEKIASEAASDSTRVCLLRTGVVLDKAQGALPKMALPVKLGLGGKIGHGKQYLSWIHIDDMVSAILFLLQNPHCQGPYNLTAPHPQSNANFTKTLASVLNRPAFFTVPTFVLSIMMGESAELVTTGQYVEPQKLRQAGFSFQYPSLPNALSQIYAKA